MARLFTPSPGLRYAAPNRWDWILLPLVLVLLVLAAYGAMQMSRPFVVGEALPISLDPANLPYYLLRTMLRMFTALGFSLLFAFLFAALAAKYRAAEKAMIPLLDVLQSVPILGFQAIAIAPFIALFPVTCWVWSARRSSPSSPPRHGTWR
jgi:ABC-type anion transport system, duplicated permease component